MKPYSANVGDVVQAHGTGGRIEAIGPHCVFIEGYPVSWKNLSPATPEQVDSVIVKERRVVDMIVSGERLMRNLIEPEYV